MVKNKWTSNQALFEILELGENVPIISQNNKEKKLVQKISENNENGNIVFIVSTSHKEQMLEKSSFIKIVWKSSSSEER